MNTMTWDQFYKGYWGVYQDILDYRLGQHFVNLFIKDDSNVLLQGLWNKTGDSAFSHIMNVIVSYQWGMDSLPLITKGD